jgi:hypothetical protein
LFEAAHASLPLYFALKGKHGYELQNREDFVQAVRAVVEETARQYDLVVYPESRFSFLSELVANLPTMAQLRKRSKSDVIANAQAHAGWSKLERKSQERAWAEMGDVFTINAVKANQRGHYVPYLFEAIALDTQRVLFLDDFIMSGNTVAAALAAIGRERCDCFGVFYQQAYKVRT